MTEELKPCPFCGEPPFVDNDRDGVCCICCPTNDCLGVEITCPTFDDAQSFWNRRTPVASAQGEPGQLSALIADKMAEPAFDRLKGAWSNPDAVRWLQITKVKPTGVNHWVIRLNSGKEILLTDDEWSGAIYNADHAQGTTDGDQLCIARADIALLSNAMREACEFLMETKYGSPARSPGHNARVRLERALELVGGVPAEGEPSYDVKLEARPAEDGDWGDWVEIFPAQLAWVVKQGHEVRATETVRSSPAANTKQCPSCGVNSYVPGKGCHICDRDVDQARCVDCGGPSFEQAVGAEPVCMCYKPVLSRSQPVCVSEDELADWLEGESSIFNIGLAAKVVLSKFNVTCKTTEEPRG